MKYEVNVKTSGGLVGVIGPFRNKKDAQDQRQVCLNMGYLAATVRKRKEPKK